MSKIPIDLSNNIIILDALLKGPSGGKIIKMILDTGASTTTIPYEAALAIGIDPTRSKRKIEILTASAREFAPLLILPSFSLLGFTLKNVSVLCLDLPAGMADFHGLLGLNILKEFDLFLGFRSKFLELTR